MSCKDDPSFSGGGKNTRRRVPAAFMRSSHLVSPGPVVSNEEIVPMDRLNRIVTNGGLALLLGTSISSLGCRSLKSEIPPGKPYSTTGAPTGTAATPNVGFSSDPRPDALAAGGLYNGIQQASGATGPGGLPGGVQQASGNPAMGGGGIPGGQPRLGTPIGNQNTFKDAVPTEGRYGPPGTSELPQATGLPPAAPAAGSSLPPSSTPLQGALGVDLPGAQ